MPPEPRTSALPLAGAVDAALAQVPLPAGDQLPARRSRAVNRQLREEVAARRGDYHARLQAGVSLRELHRALCEQLEQRKIPTVAYNTFRQWLSPLP